MSDIDYCKGGSSEAVSHITEDTKTECYTIGEYVPHHLMRGGSNSTPGTGNAVVGLDPSEMQRLIRKQQKCLWVGLFVFSSKPQGRRDGCSICFRALFLHKNIAGAILARSVALNLRKVDFKLYVAVVYTRAITTGP